MDSSRRSPILRSISGKHLSFRSNLVGHNAIFCSSMSFGAGSDKPSSKCPEVGGAAEFGFEYAVERMKKRQMFLRSYDLRFSASQRFSLKGMIHKKSRACVARIRDTLWTLLACFTPRQHHSFYSSSLYRLRRYSSFNL